MEDTFASVVGRHEMSDGWESMMVKVFEVGRFPQELAGAHLSSKEGLSCSSNGMVLAAASGQVKAFMQYTEMGFLDGSLLFPK